MLVFVDEENLWGPYGGGAFFAEYNRAVPQSAVAEFEFGAEVVFWSHLEYRRE